MDVFPYDKYSPSQDGGEEQSDMRVNAVQFGDGYRQTAPDGINIDISTYAVAWNNVGAEAAREIHGFLKAREKQAAFLFKLPDMDEPVSVYCESVVKRQHNRELWSVSASLKRTAALRG